MITGHFPFKGSGLQLIENVFHGNFIFPSITIDKDAKDLIQKLIKVEVLISFSLQIG
jgi:hypothetical protein